MINYLEDGSLQVSGLWNAANNTTSTPHIAGLHDWYTPAEAIYAVSVAGSTMLGGVNTWNVGDYAYSDGEKWSRLQNLADAIATPTTAGTVKPDNVTTFVDANGVISAVGGGSGGVTSVSVVDANGIVGEVAHPNTTPTITLGTGLVGVIAANGTGFTAATAGDFPILNQNTTGNAAGIQGGAPNQILYQTNASTTGFINTANNSVVSTNSAGVPECSNILPPVNAGGVVVLDPVTATNSFLNTALADLYAASVINVRDTTTNTVMSPTDNIVMLNANNLIAYLPLGVTCRVGQSFTIQQGNFIGGKVMTQGGDFINGSISTFNLVNPFYSLSVFWNGSTFIIS